MVKSGIEARNLGQVGANCAIALIAATFVGLVQRSQWDERLQFGQRFRVDEHRRIELHAAVHNTMPCRDNSVPVERTFPTPREKKLDCALMA